jgi:hypothetical protein
MNNCATGPNVRCFNVTIATGQGFLGKAIGKTLSNGDLVFSTMLHFRYSRLPTAES